MFPCYRDFNLQDANRYKTAVTWPTDIPFTVANRYQVISYPISDAHKFSHILYTSIPFPLKTGIHIFLCFRFLLISATLSSCAWINPSFTLTFTCLCNIPYIRCNIVKENKSYVLLCRSLEVGSNLLHTYSWHFPTFIPFIVLFPHIIFSTTFKIYNAGGSLRLKPLIVPIQSAKTLFRAVRTAYSCYVFQFSQRKWLVRTTHKTRQPLSLRACTTWPPRSCRKSDDCDGLTSYSATLLVSHFTQALPKEPRSVFKIWFPEHSHNYFLSPLKPILKQLIAQWLRCCATNRKVAGSISVGVSVIFIDIKSFRSHWGRLSL